MSDAALRQALQNPALYPDPTTTVEVRETHISMVFLTEQYAYKIKKPVELGFLDFSTLDRRHFYCEQELTLNRRLSTDVYLEVIPLYRDQHHYTFVGNRPVAEYVLKMRRLPEDCSLPALLQQGLVTAETVEALAQRLATFHQAHPLPGGSEQYGSPDQVRDDWEENFAQTTDSIDHTITQQTYAHIRQAVTTFLTQHAAWFTERQHCGHVRDCHGDLRAEHIYFEPGHIQIIDCIEFNQRFRYIDVASEVAFLAIDLERLGAPELANHFVRAYAQFSEDASLYRLLDFYRCYRAYVRGKVTSMRLHQPLPPIQRAPLQQRAETFFALAARYATRLTRPLLLLTTGLIASGKSTVAAGVAAALDLRIWRSDAIRKELAGLHPEASGRDTYGAGLYSAASTHQTYAALEDRARTTLKQGQAVLLDAAFSKRAERQQMVTLAQEVGADCCLLECLAPAEVLRARLRQREHASTSISDAREDILAPFQRDYEPVQPDEGMCHIPLETTQPIAQCVLQALAALDAQRP
jgi:aminoglycoside phosphotransferase family enzyme/predicted kinase